MDLKFNPSEATKLPAVNEWMNKGYLFRLHIKDHQNRYRNAFHLRKGGERLDLICEVFDENGNAIDFPPGIGGTITNLRDTDWVRHYFAYWHQFEIPDFMFPKWQRCIRHLVKTRMIRCVITNRWFIVNPEDSDLYPPRRRWR